MLNKINPKSLGLLLVLFLFAVLQWYKLFYLAPNPENIWDNVYLWDWARHLSEGKVGIFIDSSHHLMRWGDWTIPTIFIWLTSDSVLSYFLSTIIPSTLGMLLFTWLGYRYIGVTAALAFVVLCFFDALIFRATFQLLPSGQGLLSIAVLFALALWINKQQQFGLALVFVCAAVLFWVYGTKETHLAFAPGFLWLIYQRFSIKPVLRISFLFVLLYVLETIAFIIISPTFPWLGRIYSLLNGGQHITIMLEHAHYVAEQTRYFDSGITMRWARTSGMTPLVIFAAFLITVFVFVDGDSAGKDSIGKDSVVNESPRIQNNELYSFNYVAALLFFSFIVCSTFFVISISPIRLGHGLVPRYATLGLPFAYLLLIGYGAHKVKGKSIKYAIALLAVIPFFIAPAIDRFSGYPRTDIISISNTYDEFAKTLANHDCVRARKKSILSNELDLVPVKYRDDRMSTMITDDTLIVQEDGWFVAKSAPNLECQNMYTISRNATARY